MNVDNSEVISWLTDLKTDSSWDRRCSVSASSTRASTFKRPGRRLCFSLHGKSPMRVSRVGKQPKLPGADCGEMERKRLDRTEQTNTEQGTARAFSLGAFRVAATPRAVLRWG